MIDILFHDEQLIVCIKPCGVLSTDEAGGLPELLRQQLCLDCVKTVHRLDRVVGGVMLLAKSAETAKSLSLQLSDGRFSKEYLAVIHGIPAEKDGTLTDLLYRDKRECKTYVAYEPSKETREAVLDYETLGTSGALTLVSIRLRTGRTHQIRAQFSSRNLPLVGDRKYSLHNDGCDIALWSNCIGFCHPVSGEPLSFSAQPPQSFPWTEFVNIQ